MNIVKPTKEQLIWHDAEIGVLIHYCMEIYCPGLMPRLFKSKAVRTAIAPHTINPQKLDPEQWVRSAAAAGAKYAVLVANFFIGINKKANISGV